MKKLGKIIYIYLAFLFLIFTCYFFFSCSNMSTGLGEEVDLEAPVISVDKLTCENIELTSFSGGVYCKKNVSFSGTATDNNKISRVYTQIKWAEDENSEFKDFKNTNFSDDDWNIDLAFDREGVCYIKFVAEDPAKNISPKSTKVITLFVDDTAPVASAWYIDREIGGIQYGLKEKEELEALDLNLPENKDAAQNVSFTICANASDTMGINAISIQIRDENGNKICDVPNSSESSYAPKFRITHQLLTAGNEALKSGKHYLQIWYDSEDIVSIPDSNKSNDVMVEGGWFIWWPESDEPKISQNDIVAEGEVETINLHIKDMLSLTVFDDDKLEKAFVSLLTEEENSGFSVDWTAVQNDPSIIINKVGETARPDRTAIYEPTTDEREKVFTLKTSETPQTMHLYVIAWDKTAAHKVVAKDVVVRVADDTTPLLIIESPKNNAIPSVEMNGTSNAYVTFKGQTLDSVGCSYLEFVWVPNSTADKYTVAKEYLESITTDESHKELAPSGNSDCKKTEKDGMKIWSAKLTPVPSSSNSSETSKNFIKHEFNFTLDLFNDFVNGSGTNEKNIEKYFLIKLTRKDGNKIYRELTLSADTEKPTINPITPAGDMQIVSSDTALTLEFNATKSSGLAMQSDKYKIYMEPYTYHDTTGDHRVEGKEIVPAANEGFTNGTYKASVSLDEIRTLSSHEVKPKFTFYATDLFDNTNQQTYTVVISDLPYITAVSSPSSTLLKTDENVIINVSFSDTVYVEAGAKPYLNLEGFTDNVKRKAEYSGGTGSTTLQFVYKVQEGDESNELTLTYSNPIVLNGTESLASSKVNTSSIPTGKNLQDKKTIRIDAKSPTCTITITSDAVVANKHAGKTYLREGRILRATITTVEDVTVQGNPTFVFKIGQGGKYELPLESTSERTIVFSKKISSSENGTLSVTASSCIENYDVIKDEAGNSLILPSSVTGETFEIDTTAPVSPTIIVPESENGDGKYKEPVTFTVSGISAADGKIFYSVDNGTKWNDYPSAITENTVKVSEIDPNGGVKLNRSAQLTAKSTDWAGNDSDYAPTKYLYINSTFPNFTIECTKADGNYKAGNSLEFKLSFAEKVKVTSLTDAYIQLSGLNNGDVVGGTGSANGGKAILKSDTVPNSETDVVYFIYEIQDPDQFALKVNASDIKLTGFKDSYGVDWNNETFTNVDSGKNYYSRSGIKCDGVAPKVTKMEVSSDQTTITLTFSEKIQLGSGKIYLRQVKGWAIPPILTAPQFNTICKAFPSDYTYNSSTGKNILSLQENDADMEDSEWSGSNTNGAANTGYHGTGQFVGPYKKTTQGLKDGKPDTDTKYVLDFDIDIWETTTTHYYGKTFNNNAYRAPSATTGNARTADDIRAVLEKVHFHERYLSAANTSINSTATGDTKSKIVTITIPKGLFEDETLPKGRKWELVIEKGSFMDMTGNKFGAEANGTIKPADAVQVATGTTGTQYTIYSGEKETGGYDKYTDTMGAWGTSGRGRAVVPANTNDTIPPVVLIKNNTAEYFVSNGVEKPWVRVDRYSYGYGIFQSNASGEVEQIANRGTIKPTGYVRVRIDCETEGATVTYGYDGNTANLTANAATASYTNAAAGKTATTYIKAPAEPTVTASGHSTTLTKDGNGVMPKIKFAMGSATKQTTDSYKYAYKGYVKAVASRGPTPSNTDSSDTEAEGVFQTVVHIVNPKTSGGNSYGPRNGDSGVFSVRGTTGFAGEPYISPFPLRDNQLGSPFLRHAYKERTDVTDSNDYYWVSYEILVTSSISGYGSYSNDQNNYNWMCNWGKMEPGEFSRITGFACWN